MRIGRWVLGLITLSSLSAVSACDPAGSVGPDAPSWFRASLQGAVAGDYEGTGEFHAGSDPRAGEPLVFTLSSRGLGARADQSFQLYRRGAGMPGRGTYSLSELQHGDARPQGFTAYFTRRVGDRIEAYAARTGQVEITAASAGRIEGTFRFTGSLYCSRAVVGSASDPVSCGSPGGFAPNAASIEVSGAFVALPVSNSGSIAR